MGVAADPVPTSDELARAMRILGLADDPDHLMKDHSEARRRAELLARLAAGALGYLDGAETAAAMDVDDRADLHRDADRGVAVRSLDLQLARLGWVHHTITRERVRRPDAVADTVT